MRPLWICLLLACAVPVLAHAGDSGSTGAFRQAYAASFYQFDACGDGVAGRIYRSALSDKLKHCPFTADSKKQFQAWAGAQRRKSGQAMTKLIEDNGGLPIRLEGMTRTCREQIDSPEYRSVRARLDAFAAGTANADSVVPQPCDATEITP